jgi:anti-sigma factor ChrR (cupin superfamily)
MDGLVGAGEGTGHSEAVGSGDSCICFAAWESHFLIREQLLKLL